MFKLIYKYFESAKDVFTGKSLGPFWDPFV